MRSLLVFVVFVLIPSAAFAQGGCAKDDLGRIFCAPPGGSAVKTFSGVGCAPGRCVVDNLGYLKCSSRQGGSAITDDLGRAVCVGGCINLSKEFCDTPTKGEI